MIIDFSKISDTDRMVIFTDKAPLDLQGKKLPIMARHGISFNYAAKIDLDTKEALSYSDPGYKQSQAPTINDLIAQGILKEWRPYREYSICRIVESPRLLSDAAVPALIKRVQGEFKKHGFNVTYEAIMHQLRAWRYDFKSGYRDEQNGYHLFTPCGCNPFSLHATELHPLAADWQETYEA